VNNIYLTALYVTPPHPRIKFFCNMLGHPYNQSKLFCLYLCLCSLLRAAGLPTHPKIQTYSAPLSLSTVATELYNFACLCGCETWSLTLRDEYGLGVFENRVFRKIFGPKRGKLIGEYRKLLNEELNDLYCSPNFVWVI